MDIKKIINNFVEAHTDEIETAIRSALSEEKSKQETTLNTKVSNGFALI